MLHTLLAFLHVWHLPRKVASAPGTGSCAPVGVGEYNHLTPKFIFFRRSFMQIYRIDRYTYKNVPLVKPSHELILKQIRLGKQSSSSLETMLNIVKYQYNCITIYFRSLFWLAGGSPTSPFLFLF